MKNTSKKIIAFVSVLVLLMSLVTVNVSAYNIGDVINYAQPTNIVATINGYQLMSFNVDDYTYIIAEDLRYYGFDVTYEHNTRSLFVQRNAAVTNIDPVASNPRFDEIGKNNTKRNILYTDIVTYVNGKAVTSYNINGETIICFDVLADFGTVEYNNDRREISLYIEDLNYNPVAIFLEEYESIFVDAFNDGMELSFSEGYGQQITSNTLVRAKGDTMVIDINLKGLRLTAEEKKQEQQSVENDKENVREAYSFLKEWCPEIKAMEINCYDGSGDCFVSTVIDL